MWFQISIEVTHGSPGRLGAAGTAYGVYGLKRLDGHGFLPHIRRIFARLAALCAARTQRRYDWTSAAKPLGSRPR